MRVLRLIEGVTKRERLRNDIIRERLSIESVLSYVERCQLRWFGHMKRMEEGRIPRRWYDWNPSTKRPVGRPRKRWEQGIDEALRCRLTSLREVIERDAFDDRRRWRDLTKRQAVSLPAGR